MKRMLKQAYIIIIKVILLQVVMINEEDANIIIIKVILLQVVNEENAAVFVPLRKGLDQVDQNQSGMEADSESQGSGSKGSGNDQDVGASGPVVESNVSYNSIILAQEMCFKGVIIIFAHKDQKMNEFQQVFDLIHGSHVIVGTIGHLTAEE